MEREEVPTNQVDLFNSEIVLGTLKGAILLILIFYAIFSLIIIRQVDLMSKTLVTGVSPIFKLTTIVHAFLAIGLVLLAWGIL